MGGDMSDRNKTAYLLTLLREHHVTRFAEEWATFQELMEAPAGGQRIDFFAVHTWRSKNFVSVAYEVKVSRGDFLKEIRDPDKRRFAEIVSNKSYFVAPIGLIKANEVPEGWGLMEPKKGTRFLRIVKHAELRESVKWSRQFIVAMLRRAADPLPKQYELFRQKNVANAEYEVADTNEMLVLGQEA